MACMRWPPRPFATGLLALMAGPCSGLANAMDAQQMRSIAGLTLLDARAVEVTRVYGPPAALCSARNRSCGKPEADESTLPQGDWRLEYRPEPAPEGDTLKLGLPAFSQLVMYAKDKVGRVVVSHHPRSVNYEVPEDPYLAHQINRVEARLREPVPLDAMLDQLGPPDQRITEGEGAGGIRYWVIRKEGQLPVAVYAVDLLLNARRDKVIALRGAGPSVDYVARELKARYKIWERNMYD